MSAPDLRAPRIASLTFLRFAAASGVVVYHYGGALPLLQRIRLSGSLLVTFFFVLSGFVLAVAYLGKDRVDARTFWTARFARIAPAYFLAFGLTLACMRISGEYIDARAAVASALLLQAWISPYPTALNFPSWSVSVEIFFYAIFPAIAMQIKRRVHAERALLNIAVAAWLSIEGCRIVSGAVLIGLDFFYEQNSFTHDFLNFFPPFHLGSFVLGIAGGLWYLRRGSEALRGFSEIALVGVLVVFAADALQWVPPLFSDTPLTSNSFGAPLFLILIVAVASASPRIQKPLGLPWMIVLGEASYAFYILQHPVHRIYRVLVPENRFAPGPDFLGFFLVLLFCSIVTFFGVERPVGRKIRLYAARYQPRSGKAVIDSSG